jgi:hypothetical protein
MDKTLSEQEARKLNKRLGKYGLKLWNNEIDVKSDSPFIFTAIAIDKSINSDSKLSKGSSFTIVVYPRAIYGDTRGTSHWNEPKYLDRLERTK